MARLKSASAATLRRLLALARDLQQAPDLNAERSFKVARRQGIPSALIFADIDGLKAVNNELFASTHACLTRSRLAPGSSSVIPRLI